jgi:hypothetical protein
MRLNSSFAAQQRIGAAYKLGPLLFAGTPSNRQRLSARG